MGKIKTIFITGGSSGIGKAIVDKFASAEGYFVCFTYKTNSESAKQTEGMYSNTLSFQCDINDNDKVNEIISELLTKQITIDILINCAGVMQDSSFLKMTKSSWDKVINTNLNSIFYFTQAFLAGMQSKCWGRIINISSVAGLSGAFGKTNYSASKAGVIGFTKALALETARKGITVNAIAPGMIDTEMIKSIPQQHLEKILDDIPMKRFGTADEIADVVFFLASDSASYITGQVISVNGGMYL